MIERLSIGLIVMFVGCEAVTPDPTATATPTAGPVAILGETPGPEASAPTSVPLVPGVDLSDVETLAVALNLSCLSGPTDPHMVGYPWVVRCEGLSTDGRVEITVLVEYWAVDAVQRIGLNLYPASDTDDVTDATTARQQAAGAVADVSFKGGTPTASRTWLLDRLGDVSACRDGCSVDAGTARLRIVQESRGAVDVYLEAATP